MKKTLLFLTLCFSVALSSIAQTAFDEIKANPRKSGGVYYAYPAPTEALTPAPHGYKPFYISHYGRHGSRYLLNDMDYSRILNMFRKASEANALNELGMDVLKRLELVWQEAEFHGDELAPLGKRQHRGIAERMYNNYPELFGKKGVVTATSTTSMRVTVSMFAFIERLKELNPNLLIAWDVTRANMSYLNYHTDRYNALKNRRGEGWQKAHSDFCARGIPADRFVDQMFLDTAYITNNRISKSAVMSSLFDITVDAQNMETYVSFYDLFTTEELYENWRNSNSWFYNCDANSPFNDGTAMESTHNLLKHFINRVNAVIDGRSNETATLRFGHDGNIIPLAAIMHLKGCDAYVNDLNKLQDSWQNYYVSPMGANIQWIFFKNKAGDVIVKFLLNEVETSIPVKTDMYPYYKWSDVEKFFNDQMK
ncbi:MAG: histidine-type phosphatase [Bacteroidaceae bacterium]|nr:histidine-type phosphatase [Bacteroidaceae bacterium]